MSEVTPLNDCVRCPHCGTSDLVITQRSGDPACWECGGELPNGFPDETIWEFQSNPYGWTRRVDPNNQNQNAE
jgi:hypothetical protein